MRGAVSQHLTSHPNSILAVVKIRLVWTYNACFSYLWTGVKITFVTRVKSSRLAVTQAYTDVDTVVRGVGAMID